jgi:hypothetical protein
MDATDVLSRGCGEQIIARGGNPGNTSIPTFLSSGGATEYHESVPPGTRWWGGAVRAEALRASRLYPVNNKIAPLGARNTAASQPIRMRGCCNTSKIAILSKLH